MSELGLKVHALLLRLVELMAHFSEGLWPLLPAITPRDVDSEE